LSAQAPASRGRSRETIQTLRRFGRRHRRWFAVGTLGSIGVVVCRLAIPWPLRWVLEGATASGTSSGVTSLDPILEAAGFYLVLAIALGGFELLQRVNLGRFASLAVRDLRSAAARSASRSGARVDSKGGDLTARVMGDSARLRADLNGVLIHASTNGLLFLAVSAVMFAVSPFFGVLFLGSGLVVLWIGRWTARHVEENARKQRKKEGRYAGALRAGLEGSRSEALSGLGGSGTQREMRAARMMGRSSVLAHAILGSAVCIGLVTGVGAVRAGTMAPGELFLFVAYALTVHRRMVQVGRQTARFGKVVATTQRLAALVDAGAADATPQSLEPSAALSLRDVRLARAERGRRVRLKTLDLAIAPGSRIAVVGPMGAGKSQLLRLLAGYEDPRRGEIVWGDAPVSRDTLATHVGFLPPTSSFPRRPLRDHLDMNGDGACLAVEETLRGLGLTSLLRNLPDAWSAEVGSADLSTGEARALALARLAVTDPRPVWVLDGCLEGLSRQKAERRIDAVVERAAGRTLVMSMSHGVGLDRFDRVLVLRRGRITFDGPPADWKSRERAA
jgi:ABC-type multidrug transport system fused ATPase/permease subunit